MGSNSQVLKYPIKAQSGAALLLLVTGLLAITGYGLLQQTKANQQKLAHEQEITRSLAAAKDALIAYAVTYVDYYGHNTRGGVGRLPCPSKTRYGSPAGSCAKNAVGYLPGVWKRGKKQIEIDHLEKFLNRDLWYSVSADYRFNPAFNPLNSDQSGNLLSADGDDQIVAVIIAPGPPLRGQNRLAGEGLIQNYLEAENADGDSVFATTGNDRLITITRAEIMPLIEHRVLGFVKDWLLEYRARYGYYPFAAPFGDPDGACQTGLMRGMLPMSAGDCLQAPLGDMTSEFIPRERTINEIWFGNYWWSRFIYYQADQNCLPGAIAENCDISGHLVLAVNNTPAQALLVSTGEAIETRVLPGGQQREQALSAHNDELMIHFFDTPELVAADLNFDLRYLDSTVLSGTQSNDRYQVLRP